MVEATFSTSARSSIMSTDTSPIPWLPHQFLAASRAVVACCAFALCTAASKDWRSHGVVQDQLECPKASGCCSYAMQPTPGHRIG